MIKNIYILKPGGSKVLIIIFLLSLQSCALVTSYQKFSLEQDPKLTFQERMTFSGGSGGSMFFFEDGTFLLIRPSPDLVENYFERVNYKIYGRFSDYRLHWGMYQVEQDSVQIELLEKVHQWGFMGMTRWKGLLKNQGQQIVILPGPVNRKVRTVHAPVFPYEGRLFFRDSTLERIKIQPERAWVND